MCTTYTHIHTHRPTGPFGVAMSPRNASHRPRHDWRALRDVSPTQGWISDPHLPSSAPHGSHCLSRDFTRSAKPALEKQTSQLSPAMHQCMDSAWMWLLAGPIKCNWPSVTLWSVFQYPVTINGLNFIQRVCTGHMESWHTLSLLRVLRTLGSSHKCLQLQCLLLTALLESIVVNVHWCLLNLFPSIL